MNLKLIIRIRLSKLLRPMLKWLYFENQLISMSNFTCTKKGLLDGISLAIGKDWNYITKIIVRNNYVEITRASLHDYRKKKRIL